MNRKHFITEKHKHKQEKVKDRYVKSPEMYFTHQTMFYTIAWKWKPKISVADKPIVDESLQGCQTASGYLCDPASIPIVKTKE